MMKRASIRIWGDVQMAGFRTFIKNVADSLNKIIQIEDEDEEDEEEGETTDKGAGI